MSQEYIEVTVHYRGHSTKSQLIKPGVYEKDDPCLYGQANFLVREGKAHWTQDQEPKADTASGPSAEALRARKSGTHIQVTVNYRGHSTQSALISPGVYEKRDPRLFGQANFLVDSGRAHWVAPEDVAIIVQLDELIAEHDELHGYEDAQGNNVPGKGATGPAIEEKTEGAWRSLPLDSELDNAIAAPLMNAGITTLGQLRGLSTPEILAVPGIGLAKLEIIRGAIWHYD